MKMNLHLIIVGILLFVIDASSQTTFMRFDTLTIEQATKIALENHPALRAADANKRAADAGLTQSRAAYFPALNAVATATRTGGWFVFNPSIPVREQSYNNYSAGFQLQQLVYDFGKTTNRVESSNLLSQASEFDYLSAHDLVVMNVQITYLALVQAIRVLRVNESAVDQAEKHLKQANAFFTIGRRPQQDVTKAELDLANANVNLIRARNLERTSRVQLDNAMGVHTNGTYGVIDNLKKSGFGFSLDSAKALSLNRRPDILSARTRVDALRSLASSMWSQHLPTISVNGAYTWNGFDFPLFSRWNIGATFSVPLFQGFGISAQATQAEANADAAQALYEQLRDNYLLEIEQNYLAMKEADERITASEKLVEQAEQNLNLAEKQYAAGVGTSLDITDAQVSLSNARITEIQALFDYMGAIVKLKRAMGASL